MFKCKNGHNKYKITKVFHDNGTTVFICTCAICKDEKKIALYNQKHSAATIHPLICEACGSQVFVIKYTDTLHTKEIHILMDCAICDKNNQTIYYEFEKIKFNEPNSQPILTIQ